MDWRAHPRSRGENSHARPRPGWIRGSSPLTRGKPQPWPPSHPCSGLIPAHAGKTRVLVASSVKSRAHPRSRGENIICDPSGLVSKGSSPLTRGKRSICAIAIARFGLIPAHAGKTLTRHPRSRTPRAHPRSRGENAHELVSVRGPVGSSPLTRGKPPMVRDSKFMMGLIPAHAGKTLFRSCRQWQTRAHPRSRGENSYYTSGEAGAYGSSPLTRGKHLMRRSRRAIHGLIPAHAGKTSNSLSMLCRA